MTINKDIYDTNDSQVAFILSFMNTEEVLTWKNQFLNKVTQANYDISFLTLADFLKLLQETFKAANEEEAAMNKLELLQQGNRPVEELVMEFKSLVNQADLNNSTGSDNKH